MVISLSELSLEVHKKKTQSDEVNLYCSKKVMNYGGITVDMVTNTLRDTGQIA